LRHLYRFIVPAAFIVIFLALATVALDKPGYYYDEVIFVPVSLRALGQCDVDAAVTREIGCLPLMQTLGYVGVVKAWLHAPVFAAFGINLWTVRLPSILLAAAALLLLWLFVRHELGGAWALLLLALTATDPVFVSHARLDWGPHVIAAFVRVLALIALWRWLQTGRMSWLVTTCIALLVGFVDKLNFLWVIIALVGAGALVAPHTLYARLRMAAPWQPVVAGVTGALLLWGMATLVRRAAQLDVLGDAGAFDIGAQLTKVWDLYAATFSGTSVLGWVFGMDVIATHVFNYVLIAQLAAAAVLLAFARPWSPARRLLAFFSVAIVLLSAAIALTRQVNGTHHLVMLWPLPTLQLVTLLAIVVQHVDRPALGWQRGFRGIVATGGAIACGALLAWNIAIDLRYVDAFRNDRDFRQTFDPAIAKLGDRLRKLDVDRVISVDWGLHQPLVTLAEREKAAEYREWTWRLIDATDLERDDLRSAVAAHVTGKRVAFVLHTPRFTVFSGARARLDALLKRDIPCQRNEEVFANAAGNPLYTIIVADYRNCFTPAKPS
jgi:Dolichyl-phosphate-mannose-protein mannosyltransferase